MILMEDTFYGRVYANRVYTQCMIHRRVCMRVLKVVLILLFFPMYVILSAFVGIVKHR